MEVGEIMKKIVDVFIDCNIEKQDLLKLIKEQQEKGYQVDVQYIPTHTIDEYCDNYYIEVYKEITKTDIAKQVDIYDIYDHDYISAYCPNCDEQLKGEYDNGNNGDYCKWCGQKLEWPNQSNCLEFKWYQSEEDE